MTFLTKDVSLELARVTCCRCLALTLSALVSFSVSSAYADTPNTLGAVTTHVTNVGTYDDGAIFIFFEDDVSSCTVSPSRIDISATHSARDNLLAMAMTAYTSGSLVRVTPKTCGTDGRNSFSSNSYMYLTDE